MKTNPNKVNQYTDPDPRQALFLKYFLDRKSKTFSRIRESGVRAGFTDEYSKTLMSKLPKWLSNVVKDSDIINLAENNLKEFLQPEEDDKKIKADMTKFALTTLAKERYSSRTELTGKEGKDLIPKVSDNKFRNIIKRFNGDKQ